MTAAAMVARVPYFRNRTPHSLTPSMVKVPKLLISNSSLLSAVRIMRWAMIKRALREIGQAYFSRVAAACLVEGSPGLLLFDDFRHLLKVTFFAAADESLAVSF